MTTKRNEAASRTSVNGSMVRAPEGSGAVGAIGGLERRESALPLGGADRVDGERGEHGGDDTMKRMAMTVMAGLPPGG